MTSRKDLKLRAILFTFCVSTELYITFGIIEARSSKLAQFQVSDFLLKTGTSYLYQRRW